ncbi:MAG: TetR/AcrR family transcriptional regulator [Megasphaera sp.]|jgi:AcrR family transcriptional regulator|nr:TetR/AcrR family transcriptional regulator [Megasphaera sp.]MCH4188271.1 TetR/AcrR family transcriptional regulator [Megasphaera sp.]MCH4218039.1 TetR/AcrR family transcriptional regulator [Megasphaera sp.]
MKGRQRSEVHLAEVRRKILNSAKDLFTQQGYKKTTIRQIVERSGVLTGSIYYLYKSKEDIFQALILSLTQQCIQQINEICAKESPVFKYAAVCEVELKAVENSDVVRECYFAGYSSRLAFEKMVEQFAVMARALFDGTPYEVSRDEYYHKTVLIKGAMWGCVAEFYFERDIDHRKSREELVALALQTFGVEPLRIQEIQAKLQEHEALWSRIGNQLRDYPVKD